MIEFSAICHIAIFKVQIPWIGKLLNPCWKQSSSWYTLQRIPTPPDKALIIYGDKRLCYNFLLPEILALRNMKIKDLFKL